MLLNIIKRGFKEIKRI